MTARAKPTPTESKLAALRRDVAHLKGAVRDLCKLVSRHKSIPWSSDEYAESDLAAVVGLHGLEQRPHHAPEQREVA